MDTVSQQLVEISQWVDNSPANKDRDPEALTWHRVTKPAEEAGEAIDEMIKFTGGNPRKEKTINDSALVEELLDTALAALGGIEHLRGHTGTALNLLEDKIARVHLRAMEAKTW